MTMSISEAPEETANFISSNRAVSGVCPAGKPVATTIQQSQKQKCKYYETEHMQIIDTVFLQAGLPSIHPSNSVKAASLN